MTVDPPQPARAAWADTFRAIARWSGGLVVASGILVLVGWLADIPALRALRPGLPAMVPNTAVAFVLTGSALLLHTLRSQPRRRLLADLCATLATTVGLLTLAEYLGNVLLGIDTLLLPQGLSAGAAFPGRPAPNTALNIVLLGSALLLLDRSQRVINAAGQVLALLAGLNGLRTLLGYIYVTPDLYTLSATGSVAVHSAVLFVVLSVGTLCARAKRGLMEVATSAGPGGKAFRWLLPAALLLPLFMGALAIQGERSGLFGPGLSTTLLTLLNLIVFASLARVLDRSDRARVQAERATRRALRRIQALHTIDREIMTSYDLTRTLDVVLDQVLREYGGAGAAVLLLDPASEELLYYALQGDIAVATRFGTLAPPNGPAAHVAITRSHVLVDPSDGDAALPLGLAAYEGVPLLAQDQLIGVLEIYHHTWPLTDAEQRHFLSTLAGQAAIAIDNVILFQSLQRANAELVEAYDRTLEGWARALELRDRETEGHTQRVTNLALRFAQALGLSEDEVLQVRRGAVLHDIGKLGVPDAILHKPGPLSDEEWPIMRRHPIYAYEWLQSIAYLREALAIPYLHHERWDGSGYPLGLRGQDIPLAARLFAIVDVWDALTSDRPYRTAWPAARVRAHLRRLAGSHFDPHLVEVFLSLSHDTPDEPHARAVGER